MANENASFAALQCLLLVMAVACGEAPTQPFNSPSGTVPSGTLPAGDATSFLAQIEALAQPGITHHLLGPATDPDLLILNIAHEQFTPTLIAEPVAGISAAAALENKAVQVVVGSGFVSELHSLDPVGLLQIGGATISPVERHGYTRILGINDEGMGVVHRNDYQRALFDDALQVGPGIIEAGRLDISERDLERPQYFRSFVGLCAGQWLAGVSLKPMNLRPIGAALLDFFEVKGLQCEEIINLAGDRQAVIAVKNEAGIIAYHGDPQTFKVSLIGFRKAVSTANGPIEHTGSTATVEDKP